MKRDETIAGKMGADSERNQRLRVRTVHEGESEKVVVVVVNNGNDEGTSGCAKCALVLLVVSGIVAVLKEWSVIFAVLVLAVLAWRWLGKSRS